MNVPPRSSSQAGFTIVELLVVMVIAGVVGSMVMRGVIAAFDANERVQDRVEALTALQLATERVTRELRVACDVGTMLSDDVQVVFLRDTDGDLIPEKVRHRYWTATDELHQSVAEYDEATATWSTVVADRVLLTGVAVPGVDTFAYLAADGTAAATKTELHTIRLTLARDLAEGDPIEVETLVHLRNGGGSCA